MSDETLIEDFEINLEESHVVGLEVGEVHDSEEPADGFRTTVIVDDGISTPENPSMMICTPADHLFLIDAEDWPRISGFKWSVSSDGGTRMYVSTYADKKKTYLHRMILEAPNGQSVDHRNGDPLDNRKVNLRLATHQENMFNRCKAQTYGSKPTASYYKGVTWDRSRGRYKAQIVKNGVNHYLGHFLDERSAAVAYDQAATEMFGEFAQINFTCEEGARPSLGEGHRTNLPCTLAS
jgi:HNH endonuclease/AP2 domain